MFQIIFAVGLLLVLWWLVRAVTGSNPQQPNRVLGFSALGLFCLVLLLLVVTGRLHVLVAAGAALLPLLKHVPRLLPWLASLRKVGRGARAGQDPPPGGRRTGNLSRAEACAILGLGARPAREEVVEAHRRLIQKMHPDRGGSPYLAARINEARDVLLAAQDAGD